MQNAVSMVFDTRQVRTFREYQSMIATRYKNPDAIGRNVTSVHQTWLGRSMLLPRSKYG